MAEGNADRGRMFAYGALSLAGLASTRYCSSLAGTFSGIGSFDDFLDAVAGIILNNTANSTTIAVWMNVLLLCVPYSTYVCRSTPDSVGKRLGWQYLGSFLAVAFAYPLQIVCGQKQKPGQDAIATWLLLLLIYVVGWPVTLGSTPPVVVFVWLLLVWPLVPLFYGRLVGCGLPGPLASYRVMGFVCLVLAAATWAYIVLPGNSAGSPFENWGATFFVCDYVVFTLTATMWAFQETGSVPLAALTLLFPAAGMCFTFDEMDKQGEEQVELVS